MPLLVPNKCNAYIDALLVIVFQALFNTTGFIGVSSYPSVDPLNPSPMDLEGPMRQYETELALFGVNLRSLLVDRAIPLHWSEFGIGGELSCTLTHRP